MTKEQVEDLRKYGPNAATHHDFNRLLDEREALLEALRGIASDTKENFICQDALAAITKAEAP